MYILTYCHFCFCLHSWGKVEVAGGREGRVWDWVGGIIIRLYICNSLNISTFRCTRLKNIRKPTSLLKCCHPTDMLCWKQVQFYEYSEKLQGWMLLLFYILQWKKGKQFLPYWGNNFFNILTICFIISGIFQYFCWITQRDINKYEGRT